MGAVKGQLHDEYVCQVCNEPFLHMDAWMINHEFDKGFPTCSQYCWNKYCQIPEEDKEAIAVFEALADEMEKRPQPQSEEDFD